MNYTVNAPISVKSVVFYDHYTVSRTKNLSTINFGADIHQALQVGTQAKPDFHFSLSGSLSERIRDARFIIAVLNAQQYEINGGVLNFSGASSNSSGFIDVSSLQKQLDFLVGMQDTLNLLHVKKDLDPSLIDEAGQNCLNILKIALLDKKSVKLVPSDSIFRPCHVANLNLLLCTLPIEGTDNFYDVYDFNQAPITFTTEDSSGNENPSSYYVQLNRNLMVWCDNIDYDIMLDTLKGIPFSEEYSQSLNTLILEMLHAYDCSNSTREDILSAVIELTDWVRKNDTFSLPSVTTINHYQAIKRSRKLTVSEQADLYQLTESPQEDEQIYVGAYLLLDSPVAATVHFSKLSPEEQSTFLGFPISHFMPNNH